MDDDLIEVLKILQGLGIETPEDLLCISDWELSIEVFRAKVIEESGLGYPKRQPKRLIPWRW